jgi:hypothetical protein
VKPDAGNKSSLLGFFLKDCQHTLLNIHRDNPTAIADFPCNGTGEKTWSTSDIKNGIAASDIPVSKPVRLKQKSPPPSIKVTGA